MTRIKQIEEQLVSLQEELEKEKRRADILEDLLEIRGVAAGGSRDIEVGKQNTSLARSKLWSSISYEILTPMDAILGMTDLILDTELTEDQQNYLEMINASADRLFGVVGDIIDYSELVEGKLRQDMVNFDLFEALEYDLYIADLSAKHKDLDFEVSFPREIPNFLHSDPSRLRQVLNNLISNSLQYTKKGMIKVKVEKVSYDGNRRLILRFTVEDTGSGISREELDTLFNTPVKPAFSGGEEKYSEGGLGLVVSAQLVQLFGGEIGVSSTPGKGSIFWFTWPFVDPAEAYMGEIPEAMFAETQDRSVNLRGAKVLLAEDEYINGVVTKAYLEQVGVDVTVVENGLQAVDMLDRENFQAVLMDVQMPEMDGIEATREIRRRERKKGTWSPIIALTAHALHGDRERCLQAGMDDYLSKPLDKDQLTQMLSHYLTNRVLIAGSDPANQAELMQSLVHNGWVVTIAETAKLAMYETSLNYFDLIVIDASLGMEEGVDAVKTIRKLEQFSGCRSTVWGMGFVDEEGKSQLSGAGVDSFATVDTLNALLTKNS